MDKEQLQTKIAEVNKKFDELVKVNNGLNDTIQKNEVEKLKLQGEYRAYSNQLESLDKELPAEPENEGE